MEFQRDVKLKYSERYEPRLDALDDDVMYSKILVDENSHQLDVRQDRQAFISKFSEC